jgi:hypothetical protein
MTDDPTTKPCGAGYPPSIEHPSYCYCHGTGRVPLDTGELLEALRQRHRQFVLFCDASQDDEWGFAWLNDGDRNITAEFSFPDSDDALRAALRAVAS